MLRPAAAQRRPRPQGRESRSGACASSDDRFQFLMPHHASAMNAARLMPMPAIQKPVKSIPPEPMPPTRAHPASEPALSITFARSTASYSANQGREHRGVGCLAFPDHLDRPSKVTQRGGLALVALAIGCDLRLPELPVGARLHGTVLAVVAMPEATMDVDCRSKTGQHDVGSAGQFTDVQAVSKSAAMKESANREFGRGILAADAFHERRPLWRRRRHRKGANRHERSGDSRTYDECCHDTRKRRAGVAVPLA